MANKRNTQRGKKKRRAVRKSTQKCPKLNDKDVASKRRHDAMVAGAVAAYESLQATNGGRLEHKMQQEFLKDYPGVTMGMIYGKQYRNRRPMTKNKRQSAGATSSGAAEPEPMDVEEPDATTEEEDSATAADDDEDMPELEERGNCDSDDEDEDSVDEEEDDDDDDEPAPKVTKASTKRGRPKGTTKAAKAELRRKKEDVANRVAHAFKAYRELEEKDPRVTVRQKFDRIVAAVCKEVGITVEDSGVNYEMIRKRLLRGNLSVFCSGQESPLAPLEKILVDFIVDMEAVHAPLSPADVCTLAMELIEGSKMEENLLEFQKNRKMVDSDATEPIPVGSSWYQGFMARNADVIASKKPLHFDRMRTNWGTRRNFEIWYSLFYKEMVEAGIYRELPEKVWLNSDGDIVDSEAEAVGMKTKFQTIKEHLTMFVIMDEMGCNTNMKKDGSVGGERCAGAVRFRIQDSVLCRGPSIYPDSDLAWNWGTADNGLHLSGRPR